MSVLIDLQFKNWEQASRYGQQETLSYIDNDDIWEQALQVKKYDWKKMDSSKWGNLAILIYFGLNIDHRKRQAETLISIIFYSLDC